MLKSSSLVLLMRWKDSRNGGCFDELIQELQCALDKARGKATTNEIFSTNDFENQRGRDAEPTPNRCYLRWYRDRVGRVRYLFKIGGEWVMENGTLEKWTDEIEASGPRPEQPHQQPEMSR
jgi:hypothetical protein